MSHILTLENIHPNPIVVYTDGACSNNGRPNAKAGYGIYFGKDDKRNVSKECVGKQSNNVAELSAIIETYFILEKEIQNKEYILIVSDSIYAIRACTTYGEKCAQNNWKMKKPIPNVDLVKKAYLLFLNKLSVQFLHVEAHTSKTDKHSIGNYHADLLANKAIGIDITSSKSSKIYLKVPYEHKENAKQYGAKWDPKKKSWYTISSNNNNAYLIGEYGI